MSYRGLRRLSASGLAIALVLLLVLPLLSTALPAVAQEETAITLWHGWTGADNTEMLNGIIERFNEENEAGVTVEATALGWDDLFSQLVLSAATGNPPDVVMFHNSEVPEFVGREMLLPIDSLMEEVEVNLEGVPQAVIDLSIIDGDFYCLPGDLHPVNLFYNIDLVEAAGLDPDSPPTNQEEFLAWAEAMTIRDDDGVATQFGLDLPDTGALPRWIWFGLLHQFGGTFLGEDGQSAVNSEAGQEALQFLVDLRNEYEVTSKGAVFGDLSAFTAEQAGMMINGPWNVNSLVRQGMNFGTAPMPAIGDQPATWANTHCLAIAKQSSEDNYVAGMEFIKWFYDNYALPAVDVGIIPVSPAALEDPILVDDDRYQYYEPFVQSLEFAVLEPAIPQYTAIFSFGKPTPLVTNLEAALAGNKTVEEALDDMKAGIDEQLAEEL